MAFENGGKSYAQMTELGGFSISECAVTRAMITVIDFMKFIADLKYLNLVLVSYFGGASP